MKTIEKEFVSQLKELLDERVYSEQNNYFINKLIEIFNNESMDSINIIDFNDLSDLLDYFNYEGYNRGLLIIKILLNNLKIIDSNPYSKIDFMKYRNIYEERGISLEQFILDVKYLISSEEDVELNKYHYEICKMLQSEEKNRLVKVKIAKQIKKAYECLDIDEIVKYFESVNLDKKSIDSVKIYLNSLKEKKVIKDEKPLSMDLKISKVKLGYTNKELKEMAEKLDEILKEIEENNIKISYDEYIRYVNYVLILEEQHQACDADIDCLYDALLIDEKAYSFLILKAKSLLQTNKVIDIQNNLQDISDVESILKICSESDRSDFLELLKGLYENLYHLDAYSHNYERTLKI